MADKKRGHLRLPVIVEGRYDKAAILSLYSGTVITTDGFSIFNNQEKRLLIQRLGQGEGIILLTDSDGGGKQIRGFVSGILPKDKIIQLYIPEAPGKEPRKRHKSKWGMLGVEGIGAEVLTRLLDPYIDTSEAIERGEINAADMFSLGLSGGDSSSVLRDKLAGRLGLPHKMSAKAMLEAVNLFLTRDELISAVEDIKKSPDN